MYSTKDAILSGSSRRVPFFAACFIFVALFILLPTFAWCNSNSLDNLHLANMMYVQEKYSEAIEHYKLHLTHNPYDANQGVALYLIASAYERLEEYDKAEQAYKQLEQLEIENEWVDDSLLKLAELKMRHVDRASVDSAIAIYNDLINRYPHGGCHLQARFGLGKALLQKGSWHDAEKQMLNILELNPPDKMTVDVLLFLGDFYRKKTNPLFSIDRALERYTLILDKYPKNAPLASVYLAIAHTYREGKKYQKALKFYQKVVDDFTDSFQAPLAQTMMGLCYEENNNIKQSLTAYNTVMKYSAPMELTDTVTSRAKKISRLSKDALQIEADAINYDGDQGKARYIGNVRIHWEDCVFTCQRAVAHLNKSYIIAEGDVTCESRNDLKISGLLMHFFPKLKRTNVYGDAKIIFIDPGTQEERILVKGQNLNYFFETDTYELDN